MRAEPPRDGAEPSGNQFEVICHLLYLASRTRRIPIVPMLQPVHIPEWTFARLSDFFDTERMSRETGIPYLEWPDLKAVPSNSTSHVEELACWSTLEASRGYHASDHTFPLQGIHKTSWPLPEHIRIVDWQTFLSFECAQPLTA